MSWSSFQISLITSTLAASHAVQKSSEDHGWPVGYILCTPGLKSWVARSRGGNWSFRDWLCFLGSLDRQTDLGQGAKVLGNCCAFLGSPDLGGWEQMSMWVLMEKRNAWFLCVKWLQEPGYQFPTSTKVNWFSKKNTKISWNGVQMAGWPCWTGRLQKSSAVEAGK